MSPFPCLIEGVAALIIEQKGASRTYDRIGFSFRLPGSLLTGVPLKSTRNADGLQYQYVEVGRSYRLDPGNYFAVYLSDPDHPKSPPANTKRVLVSLILIDDFSFR